MAWTQRVRAEFENGMLGVTIPVLTTGVNYRSRIVPHSEMAPSRPTAKKSGIIITTKLVVSDAG